MSNVFTVDAVLEDGTIVTVYVNCTATFDCFAFYVQNVEEYDHAELLAGLQAGGPNELHTLVESEDAILVGVPYQNDVRSNAAVADEIQRSILEGYEVSLEEAKELLEQSVKEMAELDAAHTAGYIAGDGWGVGQEAPEDDPELFERVDTLGTWPIASAGDSYVVGDQYFIQKAWLGEGKTPTEGKYWELWDHEAIGKLEKRLRERGWERDYDFSIYEVFNGRDYIEEEVQRDHVMDHLMDLLEWPRPYAPSLEPVWLALYGTKEHVLHVVDDVTLEMWIPGPNAIPLWDPEPEAEVTQLKNRLLR